MADPVDISNLSRRQIAALVNHVLELDAVRIAIADAHYRELIERTDLTEGQRQALETFRKASDEVSRESDAEILRLISGTPRRTN